MKASIKIVKTKDFIKTKASGELNLAGTKKLLADVAELNKSDKIHDILIDIRDTSSILTLSDIYEIVAEFGRHRQAFRNKIAVLASENQDIDKGRFLELCANNRGFNVNVCIGFEECINWLVINEK